MEHSNHSMDVCEFGQVHSQCRCMSLNKTVNKVACNMPERHKAKQANQMRIEQAMNTKVVDDGHIPRLNDDVHYVAYGTPGGEFPSGICRAAKITEAGLASASQLFVMNPKGVFFNECTYDPNPDQNDINQNKPGTFHYADECVQGI